MNDASRDAQRDVETPPTPAGATPTLRLAVISTPRSGNTWLRRLLTSAYDLDERGASCPDEVDWGGLPDRCALQIHWKPTGDFVDLLDRHRFRVVVLARHPLDVLISTLNFLYHTHDPSTCVHGAVCADCQIHGVTPRDPVFLDGYAQGPGGEDLLAYSPAWWDRPGVLRARYEDLVADTAGRLAALVQAIGVPTVRGIAEAVEANTIKELRAFFPQWDYHFWQGRPGLWRSLFLAEEARRIADHHAGVFRTLGYECDPDESLTAERADARWRSAIDAWRARPARRDVA